MLPAAPQNSFTKASLATMWWLGTGADVSALRWQSSGARLRAAVASSGDLDRVRAVFRTRAGDEALLARPTVGLHQREPQRWASVYICVVVWSARRLLDDMKLLGPSDDFSLSGFQVWAALALKNYDAADGHCQWLRKRIGRRCPRLWGRLGLLVN